MKIMVNYQLMLKNLKNQNQDKFQAKDKDVEEVEAEDKEVVVVITKGHKPPFKMIARLLLLTEEKVTEVEEEEEPEEVEVVVKKKDKIDHRLPIRIKTSLRNENKKEKLTKSTMEVKVLIHINKMTPEEQVGEQEEEEKFKILVFLVLLPIVTMTKLSKKALLKEQKLLF